MLYYLFCNQNQKELTMLLQTIISNELNKRLGREASYEEQRDAYLYIADNCDDNATFNDLIVTMNDFISDTYFRCDECGELHLREQMNEFSGAFGFYRTCNNKDCEQRAYQDAHNDPYRELRPY